MLRSQILQSPGLFCWELHGLVLGLCRIRRFFTSRGFPILRIINKNIQSTPLKTNMERKFWWSEVGRWFFFLFQCVFVEGTLVFRGSTPFSNKKKHEGAAPKASWKESSQRKVKISKSLSFGGGGVEMGGTSFFGPTKQSNKSGLAFLLSHSWNGLLLKGTYRIPQNFTWNPKFAWLGRLFLGGVYRAPTAGTFNNLRWKLGSRRDSLGISVLTIWVSRESSLTSPICLKSVREIGYDS